jgi:hypothetical protein
LSPSVRIALAVGNECTRLLPQSPKELSAPIPENLTKEDSVMAAPLFTVESTCGCENEEAFDPEAEFGREKAAKNNDAGISTGLWDVRVWPLRQHDTSLSARISSFEAEFGQGPLESIRGFLLARWHRNVCRSFRRFLVGPTHNGICDHD